MSRIESQLSRKQGATAVLGPTRQIEFVRQQSPALPVSRLHYSRPAEIDRFDEAIETIL